MKIKTIASICAGIALVVSVVAVTSWLELRKQREVNAAGRERQIEVPSPVSLPAAPPPVTTMTAATPHETPISRTAIPAPSPADYAEREMERQRKQLEDPDSRNRLRARSISSMKEYYPDLAQELGLSNDIAERLFTLLGDDSLAIMDAGLIGRSNVDAQEQLRAMQEQGLQLEESIRSLLGEKYAQWQAYKPTRPVRFQVADLSKQLTLAGIPLTTEQHKAFTTAAVAAHLRQTQEDKAMLQNPPADPADPESRAQRREESLKRTEENNRRILEAAAPYVDAIQLAAMRKQLAPQRQSMYGIGNR